MIDSEQVPWGKGEKQAGEAVEIEPETIRLQGTDAWVLRTGNVKEQNSNVKRSLKSKCQKSIWILSFSHWFEIWILSFGFSGAERRVTVCLLKNDPTTYYVLLV